MCRVTMGHLRVTVGHPRVTVGHPEGNCRSPQGNYRLAPAHCQDLERQKNQKTSIGNFSL